MKIGLIQTRGLGDIVMALPIARHFAGRGDEVLWPIDARFIPSFAPAAPYVRFIPVDHTLPADKYMAGEPDRLLKAAGCGRIIALYSYMSGTNLPNERLAKVLKFDEYKFAIAGVPFREKWNLQIVRNREREERLFHEVTGGAEYIVCHLEGSLTRAQLNIARLAEGRRIVEITARTDSIFDWLTVIERAALRVMIDSCFSNLVDQLRISGPNIFIERSPIEFTPVLLGDWVRRM